MPVYALGDDVPDIHDTACIGDVRVGAGSGVSVDVDGGDELLTLLLA